MLNTEGGMNTRNHLICAHSTVVLVGFTLLGLFLLPGWLPPPSPALPADEVVALFADNTQLRKGPHHVMSDLQEDSRG